MEGTCSEEENLAKRVTPTAVTSGTYGTHVVDTTDLALSDVVIGCGSTIYETSDSIGSDVMLGLSSHGVSSVSGLDRDLNSFKKRIDANTEEQREHADMMVGLQRKIEEYRRRIVDAEKQVSIQKANDDVSFSIKETADTWLPDMKSDAADYEWASRLDEERRRNDELHMQITQQQVDLQRLQKYFEANMQEKEKIYQTREKNLAYYLNAEQRKMLDLWEELQRVRRQFADYKEQTERDLENQKNEVAKVTQSVGGMAGRLNTSSHGDSGLVQDVVLLEAMRRFRELQAVPVGASADDYNALMKKYEETVERVIELESHGDGSTAKMLSLEAELRRTKDKFIECSEFLRKLGDLAAGSYRGDERTSKIVSLSPGGMSLPSEIYRSVRNILRNHDSEMQHIQRKLKNSDTQVCELTTRLEGTEEARRRSDKQLVDAKREINIQQRAVDDANRELRRVEDRLHIMESEKIVAENARQQLEEEVRRLTLQVDQSKADGERRVVEEGEIQKRIVEDEYRSMISELTRRMNAFQDENKRLKNDLGCTKERLKNVEFEYNSTVRKLEDKDIALKHLEDTKLDLLKDLENQRTRYDAVTNELDTLQTTFETSTKNIAQLEANIKEINLMRDEISKEKDSLAQKLADVTHKLEIETVRREDIQRSCVGHSEDVEKQRLQIIEYEREVMALRRLNDELDTNVKTGQAKVTSLENSIISVQTEVTKLTTLNDKLQKEKQSIMSSKQKADTDVDLLKEKLRKLEQECDKLKEENKALHEDEQIARQMCKEEASRIHLLERDLKDAMTEVEELKKQLQKMDEENSERLESVLRTKISSDTVDTSEIAEYTEVKVKELREKYKADLERLQSNKDDLERRVQILEDELAERQRIVERQRTEMNDLKLEYQLESDRLRAEMATVELKYQSEVEDERDQRSRDADSWKVTSEELRSKISFMEKMLEEAKHRETVLREEATEWEEKHDIISNESLKLRNEIERIRSDAEEDIQKWKKDVHMAQNELKNLERVCETLRSQLTAANDRVASLNTTINEQTSKIRELNSHEHRLEEDLADSRATSSAIENDLGNATGRLRSSEEHNAILQSENRKSKTEIEALKHQIDTIMNTKESCESEVERLKKKIVQTTTITKEQNEKIEKLRIEHDHLERDYREKTKEVDRLKEVEKTFELKVNRARQELDEFSKKLIVTETERNAISGEAQKLDKEVQLVKEQLQYKSDEFHKALDELANAHRISEEGRVNAIHQLEARRFEIDDLKSRLENSEQRLATLQQEYVNADKERGALNDAMRRFQATISRSVVAEEHVDVSTIETQMQKLMSRIEAIERERNEYRDSLNRLKNRCSTSYSSVDRQETVYRTFEERVISAEDERRKVELKLSSMKEMLKSQEEKLKQRDEERRNLKSNIVTFELEARAKDAQIRHLNDLLKRVQAELENSQNDNRALRERQEQYETNRIHLEQRLPTDEGEPRVKALMAAFATERQSLSDSLKKLASQLQISETKNADLRDDAERLKRDLLKAERVEEDLRRNLVEQTEIMRENQQLRSQLGVAQSDLANASGRKQQLEGELAAVRAELRDHKQHLHDAISRIAELQRQLQDANAEKSRLTDRIIGLEKTIGTLRNTETELRAQLSTAADERKALNSELEEMRRRIVQMESEKKDVDNQLEEVNKARIIMTKKIEILETEKHSAELVISETASQREAIERSLNALERENKELYKNCAQLQQQIAQLEMDNGERLIALTTKQKEDHEKFVAAVKAEKVQVERIVENRDRAQKSRIRQLENQLSMMREQLDNERARSHQMSERFIVNETNRRVSSSSFRLSGDAAGVAAATILHPQTDRLDYVFANRSALSSYYTVPTEQHASRGKEAYRTSSTIKSSEGTTRESYTYQSRTVSSNIIEQANGMTSSASGEGMSRAYPPTEVNQGDVTGRKSRPATRKQQMKSTFSE
uniref:227 kDa spindle- and centromere-associated protein n=1 Tax=Parascaris univalens TaxID=6257 RepID=PUMA_PARUN|nr:RecName: Full=227 kDa spindle- and centromere-associated protein; AltName: Full=PUMA1 [Parascaris univalens]AAC38995.1 PUMA1 [Parascaris univalens]